MNDGDFHVVFLKREMKSSAGADSWSAGFSGHCISPGQPSNLDAFHGAFEFVQLDVWAFRKDGVGCRLFEKVGVFQVLRGRDRSVVRATFQDVAISGLHDVSGLA
ncbi:hypothetical protein [Pseudomonas oryzihabitans]|uniref:hypothetical protein n=1 Tax=Pseudomonas oryzihabitans TaxID=47885 RepID=UPI0012E352A9|nr:hypothetical protein [Pseudomonas oryzihabitans]